MFSFSIVFINFIILSSPLKLKYKKNNYYEEYECDKPDLKKAQISSGNYFSNSLLTDKGLKEVNE